MTYAGALGYSGLTVAVRTVDGYVTSYLHLAAVAVRRGEKLSGGARVGEVGTTGRRSRPEPHLHFGVRVADQEHRYVDPLTLAAAAPRCEAGGPGHACACRRPGGAAARAGTCRGRAAAGPGDAQRGAEPRSRAGRGARPDAGSCSAPGRGRDSPARGAGHPRTPRAGRAGVGAADARRRRRRSPLSTGSRWCRCLARRRPRRTGVARSRSRASGCWCWRCAAGRRCAPRAMRTGRCRPAPTRRSPGPFARRGRTSLAGGDTPAWLGDSPPGGVRPLGDRLRRTRGGAAGGLGEAGDALAGAAG